MCTYRFVHSLDDPQVTLNDHVYSLMCNSTLMSNDRLHKFSKILSSRLNEGRNTEKFVTNDTSVKLFNDFETVHFEERLKSCIVKPPALVPRRRSYGNVKQYSRRNTGEDTSHQLSWSVKIDMMASPTERPSQMPLEIGFTTSPHITTRDSTWRPRCKRQDVFLTSNGVLHKNGTSEKVCAQLHVNDVVTITVDYMRDGYIEFKVNEKSFGMTPFNLRKSLTKQPLRNASIRPMVALWLDDGVSFCWPTSET